MNCKCGSSRIVNISGKTSDLCYVSVPSLNIEGDGYVPNFIGEDGDYIRFSFCADCGQIQTDSDIHFPISDTTLKTQIRGM